MIGIYRITNIKTGDFYIGQSRRIERRMNQHFEKNVAWTHSKRFQEDIEKYGKDSFRFEVLEECEECELVAKEAEYIKKLKPTYNTIFEGHTVSQETRGKISRSLVGRKQSKELVEYRRQKILERHKTIPQLNEGHKKQTVLVSPTETKTFESVKACAEELGVHPSTITHAIKRGNKVKGYTVVRKV